MLFYDLGLVEFQLHFENAVALNIGRFDQYMYPFYQKDVDRGVLTKAAAQELINTFAEEAIPILRSKLPTSHTESPMQPSQS